MLAVQRAAKCSGGSFGVRRRGRIRQESAGERPPKSVQNEGEEDDGDQREDDRDRRGGGSSVAVARAVSPKENPQADTEIPAANIQQQARASSEIWMNPS